MSEARVRRAGRGEATLWDRQLTKHRYQRARLEIRFVGDVFLPLRAEIRSVGGLSRLPLPPPSSASGAPPNPASLL